MSSSIKSVALALLESGDKELQKELSVDAVNKQKPRMKQITLPFPDGIWSGWICRSLTASPLGKTAEEAYQNWLGSQLLIKAVRLMRVEKC